jgi:hypothetical protein
MRLQKIQNTNKLKYYFYEFMLIIQNDFVINAREHSDYNIK